MSSDDHCRVCGLQASNAVHHGAPLVSWRQHPAYPAHGYRPALIEGLGGRCRTCTFLLDNPRHHDPKHPGYHRANQPDVATPSSLAWERIKGDVLAALPGMHPEARAGYVLRRMREELDRTEGPSRLRRGRSGPEIPSWVPRPTNRLERA